MNSVEAQFEINVTATELALRENIDKIDSFAWVTFEASRHNPPNVRG